jgi:protein tyrosine phosphatase (PTP) superfamily phosphohydrolase (DUF442 family)
VVVVVLIGLGAVYFAQGVWPNINPKRFSEVEAGAIYRSGMLTPEATRRVVEDNGIRTIIDLGAHERGSRGEARANRTAASLGVTRYRLDLYGDATGNPNDYLYALRLALDPANQPVLIHCGAGTERTGAAVALYRMLRKGWTREEAMAEAIEMGHDPERNPRFSPTLDVLIPAVGRALEAGDWVTGAQPLRAEQLEPTTGAAEEAVGEASGESASGLGEDGL